MQRNSYTTSYRGLGGKASLETARTAATWPVNDDPVRFTLAPITALPDRLRAAQQVFDRTGGPHASGFLRCAGTLLCSREDVGRRNAVDEVAGRAVEENRSPLVGTVLMVSSRATFELVQKAVMAGIPALVAVSAPSPRADLAEGIGLILIGSPPRRIGERLHRITPAPLGEPAAPPRAMT